MDISKRALCILLCLAACSPVGDDPETFGEVAPRFTRALQAYKTWDKSCEPGDASRDTAIQSGISLLKIDAMTCQHARLSAMAEQTPPSRRDRETLAELTAALYGMTADPVWRTREYCDWPREDRYRLSRAAIDRGYFASNQGTPERTIVEPAYIDRVNTFFGCKGDYDPPDFSDE